MEKIKITAIIKTNNSEKTIIDALESISFLDEIIVLDENSTDDTPLILKEYKAKTIFIGKNETKGILKGALEISQNDWIFIIQDDEIIPKALLDEINSYILKDSIKKFSLNLAKKTFYQDTSKELKFLRNNSELRIFKKDYIDLEKSEIDSIKLKNTRTYSINKNFKIKNGFIIKTIKKDISDINFEIIEKNRFKIKQNDLKRSSCFLKPLLTFIYFYFVKGALFSGKIGYIYSIIKAYDKFIFEVMKSERS